MHCRQVYEGRVVFEIVAPNQSAEAIQATLRRFLNQISLMLPSSCLYNAMLLAMPGYINHKLVSQLLISHQISTGSIQ